MTRGAVRVESAWTTNAVLTTAAALGLMIILAAAGRQPVAPELLLAAAGNLLLIAWSIQSRGMFAAFQATLLLAATFAVHDACAAQAWSAEASNVWLHPATLQWLALAWSVYSLTWMVVRWLVLRWLAQPERQVEPRRLALLSLLSTDSHTDRAASAAALTVSVLVCAYSVVPGVAQELAPRGLYAIASDAALAARQAPSADLFELRGIPHGPAAGVASWLALLGLGATLSIGLRMRWSAWKLFGVALVLLAVAFLLAGRWESQVACASALRWALACYFAIASLLLWIFVVRRRRGELHASNAIEGQGVSMMLILVCLSLAPLLGMALYVGVAAVGLSPPAPAENMGLAGLGGLFFASCVLAATAYALIANQSLGRFSKAEPGLRVASLTLVVLGAAPLLAMTLFVLGRALSQHPIIGPDPDSFFARIGLAVSYSIPVMVIAATFVGHAIVLRSDRVGLAAGLVWNVAATAAYILANRGASQFAPERWLRLAQLNAAVAAVFGLAWVAYFASRRRRLAEAPVGGLMAQVRYCQRVLGGGFVGMPGWVVVESLAHGRSAASRRDCGFGRTDGGRFFRIRLRPRG